MFLSLIIYYCFDAAGVGGPQPPPGGGPQLASARAVPPQAAPRVSFYIALFGAQLPAIASCKPTARPSRQRIFKNSLPSYEYQNFIASLASIGSEVCFSDLCTDIFFTTIPQECCILPNIHYLCGAVRRMATYLFSESVSLILVPISGKFQANRDRQYRTFITVYSFCIGSRYGDCSVWGIVYLFAGIPEPRY